MPSPKQVAFHHWALKKSFSNEEMPGFGISILTAMLPVALMAIATMIQMMHLIKVFRTAFLTVIQFLGNATIAMLVSFLFALYTMGIRLEKNVKELMDTCGSAIAGIAGLLLIIGGGGIQTSTD